MSKPYFTLLSKNTGDSPYCIEFGSFDRADCVDERDSALESADACDQSPVFLIIKTDAAQHVIDQYVALLNEPFVNSLLK